MLCNQFRNGQFSFSDCLLLLCWAHGLSDVDYLMDSQQPAQKQQCSLGRPQPEHVTNLTVCTCVCEDVHTSSFETGRFESEAGNRNHARWEGGGGLIITGLCERMNMCLCGKEKLPNCIRRFQLHSSVRTSQQGNHRDGILLENHAHIQKPSQNFLSFKSYVPPQHDFRFLLVRAKDSDYIKGNYEQEQAAVWVGTEALNTPKTESSQPFSGCH